METRFVQVLVLMLSLCFIVKGKQSLFIVVPKCAFENTSTETKELCMHVLCFCFCFSYLRCCSSFRPKTLFNLLSSIKGYINVIEMPENY